MSEMGMTPTEARQEAAEASRMWGLLLVVGILMSILGLVVLSYSTTSIAVTAILIGVSFFMTGLGWFVMASVAEEFKWVWIVGGVLAVGAGIIAFVWPDETLRILSLLLGWFLLLAGIIDIVISLTNRDYEGWWLKLISGIIMVALGAWAAGEPDRSVVLLITIVGVFCLIRGIIEIVMAFQLRKVKKELIG